jgi:hypothetical protein
MDKVLNYIRRCIEEAVPINPAFSWWAFWGSPEHHSVPMCHKWGYTFESVETLLRQAGYLNLEFASPRYHYPQRDMRIMGWKA